MTFLRGSLMAFALAFLFLACSENATPFPILPNPPSSYTFDTTDFVGPVAMFTYQCYSDSDQGLLCTKAASLDTAGCCTEYYYRDNTSCLHLSFTYDSLHRRTSETAYLDTAGTSFDTMTTPYSTTSYRYSCNGRRCIAHITSPNGRRYRFVFRYNAQRQLTRFIYPDGSRFSYHYDPNGTLIRRTNPDGSTTNLQNANTNLPDYRACTYDSRHNWIRRTSVTLSQPTTLEIRTLKYYD